MITDGTKLLVLLAGSVLTAAGVAGLAIAIGHGHLQTALSFGLVAIVGVAAIVYGGWLPLAQTAPSPAAPGARTAYPLVLEGQLDSPLSRWRWLLKWLLALPHLFVLALLVIAFTVLTIAAFFAILVSGRYPRPVFETNVGILRWGWRVGFYAYGVLGTDRYPPFSLQPADYPAGLTVRYPEHWSRGLALVKWWLLAVPHYVIVGLFTSSGAAGSGSSGAPDHPAGWHAGGGLLPILVLFAGVWLLFTGRYPAGIFDLVMGLNRWIYRVVGYAGLMYDDYPPFRLDLGAPDPGAVRLMQR